jgi:hypothetical protein
MLALIDNHRPQIAALCRRHHVVRLDLFGSAARGNFDESHSDLDFFVEFEDLGWEGSSDRYFGLLHGLEDLLGRQVDLVDRTAVTNPHFRKVAEQHREAIFNAVD